MELTLIHVYIIKALKFSARRHSKKRAVEANNMFQVLWTTDSGGNRSTPRIRMLAYCSLRLN
jgi:hypothetical protein